MSRRPDGLLNHNVLEDDKGPQDACGVFGVWAPGEEVAKLTFYGLLHCNIAAKNRQELQHLMANASWSIKIWALSLKYLLKQI